MITNHQQWLVVGITGVTNGGKSSLSNWLEANLPSCLANLPSNVGRSIPSLSPIVKLLHQDDYFLPEADPRHIPASATIHHHNWDVLSALDMSAFVADVKRVLSGGSVKGVGSGTVEAGCCDDLDCKVGVAEKRKVGDVERSDMTSVATADVSEADAGSGSVRKNSVCVVNGNASSEDSCHTSEGGKMYESGVTNSAKNDKNCGNVSEKIDQNGVDNGGWNHQNGVPNSGKSLENGSDHMVKKDKISCNNTDERDQTCADIRRNVRRRILLLEGFCLLDDSRVRALLDVTYFLSVPKSECLRRRSSRNYDPPDVPGYFEECVWPEYEAYAGRWLQEDTVRVLSGVEEREEQRQRVLGELGRLLELSFNE